MVEDDRPPGDREVCRWVTVPLAANCNVNYFYLRPRAESLLLVPATSKNCCGAEARLDGTPTALYNLDRLTRDLSRPSPARRVSRFLPCAKDLSYVEISSF